MSRREERRAGAMDALLTEWPRILATQGIPVDTCVTAATFGAAALRELGLRARPVPCRTLYANAAAAAMLREGLRPQTEEWERVGAERGAREVAVGFGHPGAPEGRYNGHMVIAVDERWAVDPTAGQFNRSGGIVAAPCRFEVGKAWLRGDEPQAVDLADGGFAIYEAMPGDKAWAQGHYDGWARDVVKTAPLIAKLLRDRGARDV